MSQGQHPTDPATQVAPGTPGAVGVPAAQPAKSLDLEQQRTRRMLATLIVMVLALTVAAAALVSWYLYRSEYANSRLNLERFAHAVSEQTEWEMQQLDTVLQLARTWLGRSEQLELSSTSRLQERIQPRLIGLPAVQSVIVSNENGTLRMVTRGKWTCVPR